MNTEQNSENSTGVALKQESGLLVNSKHKFTADEAEGAMGVSKGGYNKEYKYFLKASPSSKEFQLIDNETNDVVKTMDKVDCVIYHGHSIYKLLVGHLEGLTGDHRKWAEGDENENKRLTRLAAISYNAPTAPKNASRGNFDRGNYSSWFDIATQKEVLEKRQVVVLMIPELIADGTMQKRPVMASFGGSSIVPFSNYVQSVNLTGGPAFMLRSTISFESDKKKGSNDTYNKVVFDFEKNQDGQAYSNMMFSGNEPESDPKTGPWGIRMRTKIEGMHNDYVLAAENGEMAMSGAGNDSNTIETIATTQPTTMSDVDEPFNDDIPF